MASDERAALTAALGGLAAGSPQSQAVTAVLEETWQPDSQHTLGLPGSPGFRAHDLDSGTSVGISVAPGQFLHRESGEIEPGDDPDQLPGVLHADRIEQMVPQGLCLHNAADGARSWFWA